MTVCLAVPGTRQSGAVSTAGSTAPIGGGPDFRAAVVTLSNSSWRRSSAWSSVVTEVNDCVVAEDDGCAVEEGEACESEQAVTRARVPRAAHMDTRRRRTVFLRGSQREPMVHPEDRPGRGASWGRPRPAVVTRTRWLPCFSDDLVDDRVPHARGVSRRPGRRPLHSRR